MEEKESKKGIIVLIVRVAVSLTLALLGQFYFSEAHYGLAVNATIMAIAWAIVSYDVVWDGLKNLFKGKNPFDEHLLMTISSIGAFCLRCFGPEDNEFLEGVLVMLLYQVGEAFEDYAAEKSRKAITSAIDLRDEKASVVLKSGEIISKKPEELAIGDHVLVKVGEKILCDGSVYGGNGAVNESSLTGESVPVEKKVGSAVLSGTILESGSLTVSVEKEYQDSTVKKMLDLMEESADKKSKTDRFIDRFARLYTPIVVALSLFIAIIPPLFLGIHDGAVWSRWVYTALCLLVISCPCAIVISVPLAYFAGLGLASKNGILVKGSEYFDKLNQLRYVAFDKTGTLTEGRFHISKIVTKGIEEKQFLEWIKAAECRSSHPLARAIVSQEESGAYSQDVSDYEEVAGFGVRLKYKGHRLVAGNLALLNDQDIGQEAQEESGSLIYLAVDDRYVGYVVLNDTIRPSAKTMVDDLHKMKVKTMLLSGDRAGNAESVAREIGLDECHAELTPEEKTAYLQEKINEGSGTVAYVGDGINDAPSIVLADIGIAMGGFGSDVAVQNADVVLANDDLGKIVLAKKIAKATQRRAMFNIIASLAIKVGVMIASLAWPAFPLWIAVFADSGVAALLTVNSLLLIYKKVK